MSIGFAIPSLAGGGGTGGRPGKWPSLLIIGAHKGGTTSLHRYLDLHPDIRMSTHKELSYFTGAIDLPTVRSRWEWGPEWYRSNFVGPERVQGESSTSYTDYPRAPGVPERIHESIPDVKLIYAVRDPIDRFVSQYRHVRGLGRERRTLAEVLQSPSLPESAYLLRSCYWLQIEQYLKWFDPSQIHLVSFRDLRLNCDETLARIFGFLGVSDDFRSPRWGEAHNVARRYPLLEVMGRYLSEPTMYQLANEWHGVRKLATAIERPQREKPAVPDELWAPAKRILARDAERLREFSGLDFRDWSV